MKDNELSFGYALTGSFCTFERSISQIEKLVARGINVIPIMSYNASRTDTRFGRAEDFINRIEAITKNRVIRTLETAEPIGPKGMTELMIVVPCTATTLAKLRNGIYDTPVTLAVKSHLRNGKNVLIGVSTNDALGITAKNIGELMNFKHFYFLPLKQDSPEKKPCSIVCDFEGLWDYALAALQGKQLQPVL